MVIWARMIGSLAGNLENMGYKESPLRASFCESDVLYVYAPLCMGYQIYRQDEDDQQNSLESHRNAHPHYRSLTYGEIKLYRDAHPGPDRPAMVSSVV